MKDQELYEAYMKNIAASVQQTRLDEKQPDESLMRKVESGCGISQPSSFEFRRNMLVKIAADAILGKDHDWRDDREFVYVIQQIVGGE